VQPIERNDEQLNRCQSPHTTVTVLQEQVGKLLKFSCKKGEQMYFCTNLYTVYLL
jgi:hypothetical protein